MKTQGNFDRLAKYYRLLEYFAFGRALERARYAHLDHLRNCRSILILGEGDGRCLAKLVHLAPQAQIECLDFSQAMLARAAQRIADTAAVSRVTFRLANLLTESLPPAHYDAVVTFFFLDCFTTPEADALLLRIHRSLKPEALWLWADFTLPTQGYPRVRARFWLTILYFCFRWETGMSARKLPAVEPFFTAHGYRPIAMNSFQSGLVASIAWQTPPAGLSRLN